MEKPTDSTDQAERKSMEHWNMEIHCIVALHGSSHLKGLLSWPPGGQASRERSSSREFKVNLTDLYRSHSEISGRLSDVQFVTPGSATLNPGTVLFYMFYCSHLFTSLKTEQREAVPGNKASHSDSSDGSSGVRSMLTLGYWQQKPPCQEVELRSSCYPEKKQTSSETSPETSLEAFILFVNLPQIRNPLGFQNQRYTREFFNQGMMCEAGPRSLSTHGAPRVILQGKA